MLINTLSYLLHSLSPIRILRGYGHHIHSPFTYSLVRNIIGSKKYRYYRFDDIETVLLANSIKSKKGERRGEVFYKLSKYLNCKNIVQVGVTNPTEPLYLTTKSTEDSNLYVIEENEKSYSRYQLISKKYNKHFRIERIPSLEIPISYDAIFIDQEAENNIDLSHIIKNITKNGLEDTVVVLYSSNNKRIKREDRKLINREKSIRVIIDMYDTIIIFLKPTLNRQRYYIKY